MTDYHIDRHPILPVESKNIVNFRWNGSEYQAKEGDTIASALFSNGFRIFGHHAKDGAPQGLFCANGQCAQCLVLMNGLPVKACMELIRSGMDIRSLEGVPPLPQSSSSGSANRLHKIEEIEIPVLIIGGGPAGLSAAIELGKLGIDTLLIDDKHRLGGKLVLQTHRFFGSSSAVFAGTRGIDIATRLENELRTFPHVRIWTQSTALAVFSDKKVGVLRNGETYVLVAPKVLLSASGAREKNLAFPGNSLPGVYGAGAFQTLVNRDLVRPAKKLFIVGGGNVGLIAGYHALQAGISVMGLVEAMPECGGYKVHKDKLARFGVPIMTSHTILEARGKESVESVTIAGLDEKFRPVPGTERSFACDTVLIAVGLDPVNEFHLKAKEFKLPVFAAGDAEEIAEASAAIFSGKIKGLEIAGFLGLAVGEISPDWYKTAEILKSKPGAVIHESLPDSETGVFPVLHCVQEIPCDPCTAVCPGNLIRIDSSDIRSLPGFFPEKGRSCTGCEKCVAICPGLAITLVDYRKNHDFPTVVIPYEFLKENIEPGDTVSVQDIEGRHLGRVEVQAVRAIKANDRTILVKILAPKAFAKKIAGIRVQGEWENTSESARLVDNILGDDAIICRCERVTAGEIRNLIQAGVRDINEIKSLTRTSMGSCGAKTCTPLIHRLFREAGVAEEEIIDQPKRPLFMEVPLGVFAGIPADEEK